MFSVSKKPEVSAEAGGVLVIEDSEVMQRRYAHMLTSHRLPVCGVAGSGREAVLMSSKLSPQVIILDHELPDGNGLHIIAALQSFCPGAAIFVISGSITASMAQQYVSYGVRRLMSKPINESQLIQVIRASIHSTAQSSTASH